MTYTALLFYYEVVERIILSEILSCIFLSYGSKVIEFQSSIQNVSIYLNPEIQPETFFTDFVSYPPAA